jgi:4-hydroxy-3-methylbut-2-enyl diphosphate reductase
VEKVWKRSDDLGRDGFTVVVHGKSDHEETRATFSHSARSAPTVVVRDLSEARLLADVIRGAAELASFHETFGAKCSGGFDPEVHLRRIGVVNQTTMLATETRQIAALLRLALVDRYGEGEIGRHFADTSDTLCYATNENQNATRALVDRGADLAVVVGGYNSSNTSHIVELCAHRMATFFVKDAGEVVSEREIRHFDLDLQEVVRTADWLPEDRPLDVAVTCGASCPDAVVDDVIGRILSFFDDLRPIEAVLSAYPEVDEDRPIGDRS